jgi:hypothetical protein
VRSTLAIYITLSAVAVVAIAQILYFKLVLARDKVVHDETPDMAWLYEPVGPVLVEVEEPEPLLAPEPALLAA